MRGNEPGYYYVVPKRGDDWEVWMWTGHDWYEPGESDPRNPPFWSRRVPQAPRPDEGLEQDTGHWHVILDSYGDPGRDSGDVITKDGEVIGTWSADPEDHYSFTPLGETEHIIWSPFLGQFCKLVAEWHEERNAVKLGGAGDAS